MPWGAIIGAGANLLGGALKSMDASAQNKKAMDLAANQYEYQRQFASHSLQWRAEDAMRAYDKTGIHPLAMLGVQGASYTPVSANFQPSGMGDSIARAGQDVSRAIHAGADRRLRAQQLAMQEVQMNNMAERGQLENEALRLQIASQRLRLAQQSMPGVPAGRSADISHRGVEPKIIPDVGVAATPRGGYVVVPGSEMHDRMEEIFGLGPEWFARNRAWLATEEARKWVKGYLPKPPEYKEWRYHPPTGEWLPEYMSYPDRHLPAVRKNKYVSRGRQLMRVYDR